MLLHNTLGKGGASPSRCIPPEQGAFAPPCTHDEEPGPVPATFPNPARIGCAATACPVASTVRLSRPTPRRGACLPLDPAQPCAGWMRGNGVSRCIDIRGLVPETPRQAFAPDTTSRGASPAPRSMTGAPDDDGLETRGGDVRQLFICPTSRSRTAATAEAGPPYREHERPALRATSGCRPAHRMARRRAARQHFALPCWRPPTTPG